jgi:hypothetical protein
VLDADHDPDYLVPNTSLKYPDTCHLIVRQGEIIWRATPHGTSNRVETVDLPIVLIKEIAQHEDYLAWAAEHDAWIEEHGSTGLQHDLLWVLSNLERDYIRERAAKELPGFIPDFIGLSQLLAPTYEPSGAILEEVQALTQQGYHAYTQELRQPPYGLGQMEIHGYTWHPCECIVIEGYLGTEYKLFKEFPISL